MQGVPMRLLHFFLMSLVLASCITTLEPNLTFIEKLPSAAQSKVLWLCDFEDGSFTKWEGMGPNDANAGGGIFNTDVNNVAYGIENALVHTGRRAAYATIFKAVSPGSPKAIRFLRWTNKPWYQGGQYFPTEAYYSTFMLVLYPYSPKKDPKNDPNNDGGWWNIFQFKSSNNAGSHPVVALDLYNKDNQLYLGLVIKDYPNNNSSSYTSQYIYANPLKPLKINDWNHIEAYYKKSTNYDGEVKVWLNGTLIFSKNNIRTMLPPDQTVRFGIGNYTDWVTGGPNKGEATLYFDDVIVSEVRM